MLTPPMRVFLVRHADADAEVPEGLGDEARALTARARLSIGEHFRGVGARIGRPSLMLTSPLVRAVQTAQILSMALGYDGLLKVHRALLPDMPVGALDALLREKLPEALVLVGHQPSVGAMAAHLLGLQGFPRPVSPGTVIGLELADALDATGRLLFFAAPGQPVQETLA